MATLLSIYNLLTAEGNELFSRHMAAVMLAARTVIMEPANTPNHANRLAWATSTVYSRDNLRVMAEQMFIGLITDATIQDLGNLATDAEIQATVDGLVDYYANQLAAG